MTAQQDAAEVLAAHSGWSQVGPDASGLMEVECFDCGERLGDDGPLIEEWEARTGKTHTEWATRGASPAFDEAQAQHQADMLAAADLLPTLEHDAQVAARALRKMSGLRRGADEYGVESVPAQWIEEEADRIEREGLT